MHAVKHAVRFGATVARLASPDPDAARGLLARLAPDVVLPVPIVELDRDDWSTVAPRGLPSPLLGVARRPPDTLDDVLSEPGRSPVVLLESPTHLGNLGAVVRVAAAADAAGVLVLGAPDPWHPTAVRTAAGLQYALPTARRSALADGPRPLVAVHPDGDVQATVPPNALLAFGTERHGLSDELLDRAVLRVALPMRAGVSSLNLATAVSALLYRRGGH